MPPHTTWHLLGLSLRLPRAGVDTSSPPAEMDGDTKKLLQPVTGSTLTAMGNHEEEEEEVKEEEEEEVEKVTGGEEPSVVLLQTHERKSQASLSAS